MSDSGTPSVSRHWALIAAITLLTVLGFVVITDAHGTAAAAPPAAAPGAAPAAVSTTMPRPTTASWTTVLPSRPTPPGTPDMSPLPPTAPTNLVANPSANSVTLTWTASTRGCCVVTNYEVQIAQAFNDALQSRLLGNVTTVTLPANPLTQYTYRVVAIDSVNHRSAPSNFVTVVTPVSDTASDRTPPSAPSGLTFLGQIRNNVSLSWTGSTDDVGVAGYYIYSFDGLYNSTIVATSTGTSAVVAIAASPRNIVYVRAFDAAGNVSIASNIVTVPGGTGGPTTPPVSSPPVSSPPVSSPPPPAIACQVAWTVTSQWQGGFVAGVTITNTGTSAINGWTLSFTFGADQRIAHSWNAAFTQTGAAVSMRDAGWNAAVGAGAAVSVGMQGSWSGANTAPAGFAVNGVACTA